MTEKLDRRLGWEVKAPRDFEFGHSGDRLGWIEDINNRNFILFIQNGRVKDTEDYLLKTALREIAGIHTRDFRLSLNQNLVVANVSSEEEEEMQAVIDKYKLTDGKNYTGLRRNSMTCVAFPTRGLATAGSERYLPSLITKIKDLLDESGLKEEEITIRTTGCPNGCARPALAEIASIGKAPGKYNIYLGGSFKDERLDKIYKENIDENEILESLHPLLLRYSKERLDGEHFGDFVIRDGVITKAHGGRDFHS